MDNLKDGKPLTPHERMLKDDQERFEWECYQENKKAREKAAAKAQRVAQLARIEAKLDEVLVLLRS